MMQRSLMWLQRHVWNGLGAALLVCATVGTTASAQLSPVRVRLPGYNQPISLDSAATTAEVVAASHDATRAATVAVLEELKVPVTTNDPAGLIGNGGMTLLRRLGNERLSKYLNCGVGLSGPQADTWRVTMALMVWIEPAGSSESRVRMALVAGAQDLDAGARRSAGCGSTGALESLIVDRVRRRVVPN
ncbi:hypothetical protein [Gemmatimonas sp.]|uniref:hypothetical protein n=1 Tax=Gemmatimonas sp. TaxID=1962908 RepID=UPI00286DA65C|nr:hypothetical protein [Gemmatimonas sp.]